jgi:hypothetical protein
MNRPNKSFFNFVIVFTVLLAWQRCDQQYFRFKGTAYSMESGIKSPLDSIQVMAFREYSLRHKDPRTTTIDYPGTTFTNAKGHYQINGVTQFGKSTYYLVFSKPFYKTDTVKIKKNRNDHEMKVAESDRNQFHLKSG